MIVFAAAYPCDCGNEDHPHCEGCTCETCYQAECDAADMVMEAQYRADREKRLAVQDHLNDHIADMGDRDDE